MLSNLEKIMVVEDDPDIQKIAKMALEAVGKFTVKICSTGQQALNEAPAFTPQLVLMDVMMPGMDGPATLLNMRQMQKINQIPVIFMTAKVQTAEVENYKKMGALDVISKPFDPMTLSSRVKKIWDQNQTEKR